MKRIFILHILFLFMIGLNAQAYETQTHLKRFGYTTSVGQPVNYNSNVNTQHGQTYGYTTINYGHQTMRYNNNAIYSGTYNPGTSSKNSGHPGTIRKVCGYTTDGTYVGDDNGEESDFWETGYKYYWDDVEKCWYRQGSDGWKKYTNKWGLLFGWHWSLTNLYGGQNEPANPVSESFKKRPEHPDDPNPTPLNDGLFVLCVLLLVYTACTQIKRENANV